MNRKSFLKGLFLLCLLITALSCTSGAAEKKGLVKVGTDYYYYGKDGQKVTNKWRNVGSNRYYFGPDGIAYKGHKNISGRQYVFLGNARLLRPQTSGKSFVIHPTSKRIYYMTPSGICMTGWLQINGELYFADSIGRIRTNCEIHHMTMDSTGKAKNDIYRAEKLLYMQLINQITTPSMSRDQKLRACFNYVCSLFSYTYYDRDYTSYGWQKREAYEYIVRNGKSDCTGIACAFAALAAELGYNPYIEIGRVPGNEDGENAADGLTKHWYVTLGDLIYDPEAYVDGWLTNAYGISSFPVTYQYLSRTQFLNG